MIFRQSLALFLDCHESSRSGRAARSQRGRSLRLALAAVLCLAGASCGHAQSFDEGVLRKDGVAVRVGPVPAGVAPHPGRRSRPRVPRRRARRLGALQRALRAARRRRAARRAHRSSHHGHDRARVRRAGHRPVRRPRGAPHAAAREARRRPDAVRHLRDEEGRLRLRPRLRGAPGPLRRGRARTSSTSRAACARRLAALASTGAASSRDP